MMDFENCIREVIKLLNKYSLQPVLTYLQKEKETRHVHINLLDDKYRLEIYDYEAGYHVNFFEKTSVKFGDRTIQYWHIRDTIIVPKFKTLLIIKLEDMIVNSILGTL